MRNEKLIRRLSEMAQANQLMTPSYLEKLEDSENKMQELVDQKFARWEKDELNNREGWKITDEGMSFAMTTLPKKGTTTLLLPEKGISFELAGVTIDQFASKRGGPIDLTLITGGMPKALKDGLAAMVERYRQGLEKEEEFKRDVVSCLKEIGEANGADTKKIYERIAAKHGLRIDWNKGEFSKEITV